jgi:hypothetical protein
MPRIPALEFEQLPLRVHEFLVGVPLHDVWAIDLPRLQPGITLDAFLRANDARRCRLTAAARMLLKLRFVLGRLFRWDREPASGAARSFSTRLTAADRARSLAATGARDGPFRIVYRFDNEQLSEIINRTAHAASLTALVETEAKYRFYLGVYVRRGGPFTRIYMAAIDPFRKVIVYPSLLRSVRASWHRAFGTRP